MFNFIIVVNSAVKRIIGRSYEEPCMEAEIKGLAYEVVNFHGKPKIKVEDLLNFKCY